MFACKGRVCPPGIAPLVFPVFSFDFSVLTFSRSAPSFSSYLSYRPHGRYLVAVLRDPLTMLVSVTADFTIRRLRVHASSYAVTNPTNRNEKSLTLIIPPHQGGGQVGASSLTTPCLAVEVFGKALVTLHSNTVEVTVGQESRALSVSLYMQFLGVCVCLLAVAGL